VFFIVYINVLVMYIHSTSLGGWERQFYNVWIILQVIHSFMCGVSSSSGGILLSFCFVRVVSCTPFWMVGPPEWFVCVCVCVCHMIPVRNRLNGNFKKAVC
jgi:hypothetical protein